MMKKINTDTWNRKKQYKHFSRFEDPYFSLVAAVDVTDCNARAKEESLSFFLKYLHACLQSLNTIENLKYRIQGEDVFEVDQVNASTTIAREDKTYALAYIEFDQNFKVFEEKFKVEKQRVDTTDDFYPLVDDLACIHCSAIPWVNFSGHKEPRSGINDSIPKIAFGKTFMDNDKLMMNVAISAHHGLVDGYHIGLFFERFNAYLN